MTQIAPAYAPSSTAIALLDSDKAAAARFLANEKSASTRLAYESDWRCFTAYCATRDVLQLPASPDTVVAYLSAQAAAGAKSSTIGRRLAAIRYAHRMAGHEPPTAAESVRMVMRGIRRTVGAAPVQKAPVCADHLRIMLESCPATLRGKRDRALLALGFAGAFRRSELVALQVGDLVEVTDGLRITIRVSKTDQEGHGQEIAIPRGSRLRAVQAVREWLHAAGITDGPVFRSINKAGQVSAEGLSGRTVADLTKQYAEAAGLDPESVSAHSLRSGFLTSGAEAGASILKLCEVSRHKSVDTLRGYVRRADLFRDHAGAAFL